MTTADSRRSDAGPLIATERNPTRETIGGRDAKVARLLGTPFIPWQKDAAELLGEIDPHTGQTWYKQFVAILPRQVGKTTFVRARLTRRCIMTPRATVRYTAQTKGMATLRLEHDFWEPISRSLLAPFLDARTGRRSGKIGFSGDTNGEHISFANSARWEVDAVKATSGHGPTLTDGSIDEAFAHKDGAIEAAMLPAMLTVPGSQLLVTSAAGTADSAYLRAKVNALRAMVELENAKPLHERRSRTAYLEYGAPPDADPDDPETYWSHHPGVGWLASIEDILAAREAFVLNGEPEEADRALLSWWPAQKAPDPVIPLVSWNEAGIDPADADWDEPPMWSVDVSPGRDQTSVGLAVPLRAGGVWLEVLAREYGTGWAVGHLVKLRAEFGGNQVAIDGTANGGAGALEPDLVKEGFEVVRLSTRDVLDGCQGLHDAIVQRTSLHGRDPLLTNAMLTAGKRKTDGGFLWVRGKSLADITPLYVATLARHALLTRRRAPVPVDDSVLDPTMFDGQEV